jgi:hypothetical protein
VRSWPRFTRLDKKNLGDRQLSREVDVASQRSDRRWKVTINRDPTDNRPCHVIGKAAINRDNWTIPAVDPSVLLEFDS